jgi:hypothetical protein
MAKQQDAYIARAVKWLELLSSKYAEDVAPPLTYLRKSKESSVNENVRLAWLPERRQRTRLLASESGYRFAFERHFRFVDEVPRTREKVMYRIPTLPTHIEVPASLHFTGDKPLPLLHAERAAVSLHRSVMKPSMTSLTEGDAKNADEQRRAEPSKEVSQGADDQQEPVF